LRPLLTRSLELAAQSCSLAVRCATDPIMDAVIPLARSLSMLGEVILTAIIERVEQTKPLDSSRVFKAHQAFAADSAEISRVFRERSDHQVVADCPFRPLASLPVAESHVWKNTEMKQFWEKHCTSTFGRSVPVDVLAVILLSNASLDDEPGKREALCRRMRHIGRQETGRISDHELDACSAEVRRCGGLRGWIVAILNVGGDPGKVLVSSRGTPRTQTPRTCDPSALGLSKTSLRSNMGKFPVPKPFAMMSQRSSLAETTGVGHEISAKAEDRLSNDSSVYGGAQSKVFKETPLHTTVIEDPIADDDSISALLQRGADVNAKDKNWATPLHAAASVGNPRHVQKLIAGGADLHKPDRWRLTPLHKAASNGQADVVRLLLKSGATPRSADEWGSTPLHRAAARGQCDVAEQLLRGAGSADLVNAEDRCGERPLHLAAKMGDYALAKVLVQAGAIVHARSRVGGHTAEDYAINRGHANVATLLRQFEAERH